MIKDVWDSIKDNIKERTTNPFLGTFIMIWVIRNWTIVYAFFYFDKDWKLQQKLVFFSDYWNKHNFTLNLLGVVGLTILVLIITYFLLGVSRYISNFYENILIPIIYKISKGKVVTYEIHQKSLKRVEVLENRLDEERKAKNNAILEREEMEKKLYSQGNENTTEEASIALANPEFDYESIIESNKSMQRSNEALRNALLNIFKGSEFSGNNEMIDFLLQMGLIELSSRLGNSYFYKLNKKGQGFSSWFFKHMQKAE